MGEEKKVVKSFRISDATQEELKVIAGDQSMDETFQLLISAYKEKQTVRSAIDSARINQLESLCTQLKELFNGLLNSQSTELERIRTQNADELEKLRRSIDKKNQDLQNAQATIQELNKKISALQSDNKILLELKDTLKSENNVLKQTINFMGDKSSTEKVPAKKSLTKKKETSTKGTTDSEAALAAAPGSSQA